VKTLRSLHPAIQTVITSTVLVALGDFLITSLLAVHLRESSGLSGVEIGTILTTLVVTQQVLPVVGGALADRFGRRQLLVLALALRVVGYLAFAAAGSVAAFVAAAVLVGAGGAVLAPAIKALIAEEGGDRVLDGYALRNVAVNVGAALGPLLGSVMLVWNFDIAFLIAAGAQGGALLLVLRGVPPGPSTAQREAGDVRPASLATLVRDGRLVRLTLASIGFWIPYTQLGLSFPLYIESEVDASWIVGVFAAANAALCVLLQTPVLGRASRAFGYSALLPAGMASVAAGFLCLAALPVLIGAGVFVVLFSLGEILVLTTLDTATGGLAPAGGSGAYFGFGALGWAAGALLGGTIGGAVYDAAASEGALRLVWLGYAAIALGAGAALWAASRPAWRTLRQPA